MAWTVRGTHRKEAVPVLQVKQTYRTKLWLINWPQASLAPFWFCFMSLFTHFSLEEKNALLSHNLNTVFPKSHLFTEIII